MDMPGFGAEFKQKLKSPGPWNFTFYGFGECLPNHENFIELDKTKVDAWGVPVLKIHAQWRGRGRAQPPGQWQYGGGEALGPRPPEIETLFAGHATHLP